jgi:hypothetical protein
LSVSLERGYPSTHTRAKMVLLAIFGMEAWHAPSQHEAMPTLEEVVVEACQEGAGHPLGPASP